MKEIIFVVFLLLVYQTGFGQPNCQILEDTLCIRACQLSIKASKYQGSKYSQELFDEAIKMCPSLAYAYYEKSVPYLKHGFIAKWKAIIDKAVELEPKSYLINRGCNQIQFFRNYKKGIKDLEKLNGLIGNFNIGYTNSGEYHGQMIRAISPTPKITGHDFVNLMYKIVRDEKTQKKMDSFRETRDNKLFKITRSNEKFS